MGDRGKTVTKPLAFSRLGLPLSEKQIPQVVENLESGGKPNEALERVAMRPRQVRGSILRPETYRDSGGGFRFRYTLHLPSISRPAKLSRRFIGVFHTLNQRRAQLCY